MLSFHCRDSPVAPILIIVFSRWYRKSDRQEVPLENGEKFLVQDGTLVISDVKRNDSGTYVCVASNSEGSESLELQLTVTSPLSAHLHPVSQTAHLGKGANLECNILGESTDSEFLSYSGCSRNSFECFLKHFHTVFPPVMLIEY